MVGSMADGADKKPYGAEPITITLRGNDIRQPDRAPNVLDAVHFTSIDADAYIRLENWLYWTTDSEKRLLRGLLVGILERLR
jgi:hypothetical protein